MTGAHCTKVREPGRSVAIPLEVAAPAARTLVQFRRRIGHRTMNVDRKPPARRRFDPDAEEQQC
jgi:hypothetical protein